MSVLFTLHTCCINSTLTGVPEATHFKDHYGIFLVLHSGQSHNSLYQRLSFKFKLTKLEHHSCLSNILHKRNKWFLSIVKGDITNLFCQISV